MIVKTRGKKCIQFTDEPSGTVYVLRVINNTSITFEVSYVISDKIITNENFQGIFVRLTIHLGLIVCES